MVSMGLGALLNGPGMPRKTVMDAVRDARYGPRLLNGQPVEVVTTFPVHSVRCWGTSRWPAREASGVRMSWPGATA